jgi:hypothetical protein
MAEESKEDKDLALDLSGEESKRQKAEDLGEISVLRSHLEDNEKEERGRGNCPSRLQGVLEVMEFLDKKEHRGLRLIVVLLCIGYLVRDIIFF